MANEQSLLKRITDWRLTSFAMLGTASHNLWLVRQSRKAMEFLMEKKRNEIFQMAMLEPKMAILDETDSGLDIDALKIVANGVNKLKNQENAVMVITHYQRLLDYIVPDYVHVLFDGKIVKSGTKDLAHELEKKGYDWIKEEVNK